MWHCWQWSVKCNATHGAQSGSKTDAKAAEVQPTAPAAAKMPPTPPQAKFSRPLPDALQRDKALQSQVHALQRENLQLRLFTLSVPCCSVQSVCLCVFLPFKSYGITVVKKDNHVPPKDGGLDVKLVLMK